MLHSTSHSTDQPTDHGANPAHTTDSQDTKTHAEDPSSSVPACDSAASNIDWIHQRLSAAFPTAEIQVDDTRGDDQHLAVVITSTAFLEKSRIACHQLVYAALDHMRQGKIHAMSLKTIAK